MKSYGLLYVATGYKYLLEAIKNARLTRYYCPDLCISICTDDCEHAISSGCFHRVIKHNAPVYSYRDKISPLLNLPYSLTLFIDTDAFVCSSLDPLFRLGSLVDMACAMAPVRHPPGWTDSDVPINFPELNSGIMLLKRTNLQRKLIKSWLFLYDEIYLKYGQSWDQATLRSVIWKFLARKRFRFLHLPCESNLRTPKPWLAGRGMPVQVIHGRIPELEIPSFVDYLNSDIDRFRSSSEWIKLHPNSDIYPRFDRI